MNILRDWRLHALCIVCIIIAELIGTVRYGYFVLIPMFFAMIVGAVISYPTLKIVNLESMRRANHLVTIALMLLIVKMSLDVGPALDNLKHASLALIMQEVGHFCGTILLGLPIAVAIGLGREAVGMTFSVGREQSIAIIGDKYTLDSAEGRGVMAQYLMGTLFGAITVGLLASIIGSMNILHPLALAMGVGVGSGAMTAAGTGSLVILFPEMESEIRAYAGVANLMSNILGIYVYIFISLPLTSWLYDRLVPLFGKKTVISSEG